MTTPRERIETDVKTALKAGEKERLGTLRMLLGDLKNERIRTGEEVDEGGFLTLVRRGIKQRAESAEQYRAGNRPELADKEEREAEVLGAYLPAAPSDDEIRQAVEAFVAERGLSGPQAIGQVMPAMIERFEGRADNATIARVARQLLTPAPSAPSAPSAR